MRILMIDNYDSFTWNLVHYLGSLGAELMVKRNDELDVAGIRALSPAAIVLSPGPCTPNEAGVCLDAIKEFSADTPILGVCLGHQAMGQAFGGDVVRTAPMHGKLSTIHHHGKSVFRGINGPFKATRYHSLVVKRDTFPSDLEVTAETEDGLVMGLQHRSRPVHGIQFHPESILSEHGHLMLRNFLDIARAFHGPTGKPPDMSAALPGAAFKPVVARVANGQPLSFDEAAAAFDQLLEGVATPAQVAAFLMALRVRGETVEELRGAVSAMRSKMIAVDAPAGAMDIVGTGGDNSGSYNVSTLAAIVTAACGVPIAKHGNVAATSQSGSADVLSALGVKVGLSPEGVRACMDEAGIAFMLAKTHHPAMRHVGPVRSELGTRTIFNLLGPQCNPARVKRLLLGVFDRRWLQPIAETLGALGAERVMVVHGADGLDEISTTGPTGIVEWRDGALHRSSVTPGEAGLGTASLADLKGGDVAYNAAALRRVLAGERSAYRDIAVMNAAGALMVAGKAASFRDGAAIAAKAIDDGAAARTLDQLAAASQKES